MHVPFDPCRAVAREQELKRLKEENEELIKKLDESKSYLEECKVSFMVLKAGECSKHLLFGVNSLWNF